MPKGSKKSDKKSEPTHKMPGGMMMSDKDMKKMMAEEKTSSKKMPMKSKHK